MGSPAAINCCPMAPGKFHVFMKTMDYSIGTLSPCKVVRISRSQILGLLERPAIARALWWAALVDEATLRGFRVWITRRNRAYRRFWRRSLAQSAASAGRRKCFPEKPRARYPLDEARLRFVE